MYVEKPNVKESHILKPVAEPIIVELHQPLTMKKDN